MKKNKQNLKTVLAICLLLTLMSTPCMAQKFEGLADRPQMGWSTWNKFQGNISEDRIFSTWPLLELDATILIPA